MEAHYTGLPLILITADRPRVYRGTGAPQSAEQVGLFSHYTQAAFDLEEGDCYALDDWSGRGPLHLNVCFEEPKDALCRELKLDDALIIPEKFISSPLPFSPDPHFLHFLKQVNCPLVVVGALPAAQREACIHFIQSLQAPVYAEAMSGIREDVRLEPLRVSRIDSIWEVSARNNYPIDGVLRLGAIPTCRLWRDLEQMPHVNVYSVSEHPFSGLSHTGVFHTSLSHFFSWVSNCLPVKDYSLKERWLAADRVSYQQLLQLFEEEPEAEPSLIHALSAKFPSRSKVYLGNSLPIREWDQAATYAQKHYDMSANRGVNGIDGQVSTFLGFASPGQDNWAILGDLTAIYDLAAPWIGPQIADRAATVVVVNNGGGRIFARMFSHPAFQHQHELSFEPWARLWGCPYEKWESIPNEISPHFQSIRLIELVTNHAVTERFWDKLKSLP
jgi:2-succinyl-5-enolpyruvyl-6-hydroxy-3-cyclohexene-1-carboxylate synthase